MKIVLASASARRKDIFNNIGIDFEVCPADVDEDIDHCLSPDEICETLSKRKAEYVSKKYSSDDIVIGSDTIVHLNGRILEKPGSRDDAFSMLRSLSGNTHQVYSGITVCYKGITVTSHDLSEVVFRELSDDEINFYIDHYPPYDKAGSYGIQDYASLFVEKTNGDYLSIIGFPLFKTEQLLYKNFGIKITDLRQRQSEQLVSGKDDKK
ncbi:MAG: septum formation protein Maf [Ruminococcaceae bacterium]|nr:septum formation protein Maf [Oscillospiraceae bacterium]